MSKKKPKALGRQQIESMMTAEQVSEMGKLWKKIKAWRIPAMAYVQTEEAFEKLVLEAAQDLLTWAERTHADNSALHTHLDRDVVRIIERAAAIAWLGARSKEKS